MSRPPTPPRPPEPKWRPRPDTLDDYVIDRSPKPHRCPKPKSWPWRRFREGDKLACAGCGAVYYWRVARAAGRCWTVPTGWRREMGPPPKPVWLKRAEHTPENENSQDHE